MRAQWELAAPGWNAHAAQIRAWLGPATEAMLNMAGVTQGMHVLDVAAGAGDQTLDIAERVGPTGEVLATDLSPAILALAADNARRAGHAQVRTRVADAEDLGLPTATFDAAICRLGLMFLPDPLQGLCEMARVLRPGGRLCTMVFSRPEANPCVTLMMRVALQHAGVPPADPFKPGGLLSLGKPGLIDELFLAAGLHDVITTTITAPFRLPRVGDYLDFVRASASPIRQILGRLDAARQQAAWDDMEERLRTFDTPQGWAGPNELLLTSARR
ncbi:MAG: class I SAM-dependent methyltransferase [Cytophagales bacterium]|nr:class I SAM-dependent methyltransferase [Rhizobacter sp.]